MKKTFSAARLIAPAFFLVSSAAAAGERPIAVSVERTPGGPRLCASDAVTRRPDGTPNVEADAPEGVGTVVRPLPPAPQGAGAFEIDSPRAHGGPVVRAADFGFSVTNDFNASAINRALRFCRARHASRLELAPGTYNCFDATTGVQVAGLEDFTLDGKGALLVFRRPPVNLEANSDFVAEDASLLVRDTLRVEIRNLKMDWDWKNDPLCDAGRIVATHVDGRPNASWFEIEYVDYARHPWFGGDCPIQTMTPIDESRARLLNVQPSRLLFGLTEGHYGPKSVWTGPNRLRVYPGVKPDPAGRHLARIADVYYSEAINRRIASSVKTGALYRVFHRYYGKDGLVPFGARHTTFRDIRIYSAFGMPISVNGASEYCQFVNVVTDPPEGSRRCCTGTSDGIHVRRSRGHLKFIGCKMRLQNDDGLNAHDCFTIAVPSGARRLKIVNLRGARYFGAEPGNELELREDDFSPLAPSPWRGRLLAVEGDELVVDRDVRPPKGGHFLVFDNTYRSDYLVLRDCTFEDTHFREIVQPGHVTVEGCVFRRTGNGFCLASAHTRQFWCEGRGAKSVVIRNCLFDHTNASSDGRTGDAAPEISSYVRFPSEDPKQIVTTELPASFDPSFYSDILIEKNRFVAPAGFLLDLDVGANVVFRDNDIEMTDPARAGNRYAGSYRFGCVRDVWLVGNRYRTLEGNAARPLVILGKRTSGLVVDGNSPSAFRVQPPAEFGILSANER